MNKTPGQYCFALVHQKSQPFHLQFLECRQAVCSILAILALFPHWWPKKSKFQKMNKTPSYSIVSHQYTKNHNHSTDRSSNSADKLISHFGPFLIFYNNCDPKYQNFQKMKKKAGDIIVLHQCTKNYNYIACGSLDKM